MIIEGERDDNKIIVLDTYALDDNGIEYGTIHELTPYQALMRFKQDISELMRYGQYFIYEN